MRLGPIIISLLDTDLYKFNMDQVIFHKHTDLCGRYVFKCRNKGVVFTKEMFEEIKAIIVDVLNCDEDKVVLEASLSDDLDADSLDAVELGMAIEENLGVAISDEDLPNIKTVQDLVDYVEEHK